MPGVVSQRDALAALARRAAEPVYLLVGDDEQGKAPLVEAISALVEEDLRGFNLQRFYANEVGFADIVAAARTLPFLGGRRVVLVLRGEAALKPKGRGAGRGSDDEAAGAAETAGAEPESEAEDMAALEAYLQSPSPDTCLAIVAADVHRGTRIVKTLLQRATTVEFWGFKAEREARSGAARAGAMREASRYVAERAREARMRIDADAIERLVDHGGSDISVLRADVERVLTYCAGRDTITEDDVRAVVGGETVHDDWAILRAIESGDTARALRLLALMLDAGATPYQVLGQIAYHVRSSMPAAMPRAVGDAVDEVFETDFALKTSRGDPQVLLERLIVKLCGEGRSRERTPGRTTTPTRR
jgi:DNA polymerase-3 subunit delta